MAIVFGIDPGSRFTGFGVVDTATGLKCLGQGVIVLPEKKPLSDRLGLLADQLEILVAKFKPTEFSVEKVFMGKNAASAFTLGHARGVSLAIAGRHQLPVFEYATRSAKKMLTGNGAATKEQVQLIVQNLLKIRETRLDATDALALAICHASHTDVKERFSRQKDFDGSL